MRKNFPPAFTLVEVMVATALLSLLLLILISIVNQTSSVWRYSTSKTEQFRGARTAFEAMTRRLSQATLNTYWDYEFSGSGAAQVPQRYVRKSDLRFLAGAAQELIGSDTPPRPGHAVFLQAPLGYVDRAEFEGLGNLLNTWGYFVEFNSDRDLRPTFLNHSNLVAERHRFRLMEMMQPSNSLNLYSLTSTQPNYTGRDWIKAGLTGAKPQTHVLAENVIALVLLPKLAFEEDETGTRLAPSYKYDSTTTHADPEINPKNQLPPLVQVTLVALDETSAARIATDATMPELGQSTLFSTTGSTSANDYATDLATLLKTLQDRGLNYRVFTSHVSIRAAKWSRH